MLRRVILIILSFLIGLFLANGPAFSDDLEPTAGSEITETTLAKNEQAGVAVVELFTSQGCSSCPPADRVLQELVTATQQDGRRVFALSFHVDYWNDLGWEDPYSLAVSTRRQRVYAKAMDSSRVYTPQMIVNGQTQFNGGNQKLARRAVDAALDVPATTQIRLVATGNQEDRKVKVAWQVDGGTAASVLNIAVVIDEQHNDVPRGENRGRELSHANVVRAFATRFLDKGLSGTVQLELPADADPEDVRLIGYTQQRQTALVSGAVAVKIQ